MRQGEKHSSGCVFDMQDQEHNSVLSLARVQIEEPSLAFRKETLMRFITTRRRTELNWETIHHKCARDTIHWSGNLRFLAPN